MGSRESFVMTGKWSEWLQVAVVAQGRGERRCKGSVAGGNNKVKCVISIVGWEIDMLGEVEGRKN